MKHVTAIEKARSDVESGGAGWPVILVRRQTTGGDVG